MFLHVQLTDVPEHEFDLQAEEKETAENKEDDTVPVKFTGYEMLTDTKPSPDMAPVGEDSGFTCSFGHFPHALKKLWLYTYNIVKRGLMLMGFSFQQEFKQLFGCWNTH